MEKATREVDNTRENKQADSSSETSVQCWKDLAVDSSLAKAVENKSGNFSGRIDGLPELLLHDGQPPAKSFKQMNRCTDGDGDPLPPLDPPLKPQPSPWPILVAQSGESFDSMLNQLDSARRPADSKLEDNVNRPHPIQDDSLESQLDDYEAMHKILELRRDLDADKDGVISREEMEKYRKEYAEKHGEDNPTVKALDRILEKFDKYADSDSPAEGISTNIRKMLDRRRKDLDNIIVSAITDLEKGGSIDSRMDKLFIAESLKRDPDLEKRINDRLESMGISTRISVKSWQNDPRFSETTFGGSFEFVDQNGQVIKKLKVRSFTMY